MKPWETVCVIGVGLIGGSIGLALRQRQLARRVIGVGRTASRLEEARQLGAISEYTADIERGVAEADVVVVCTPVHHIVGFVRQAAAAVPPHALITDAGSVKGMICRTLDQDLGADSPFVGSHPMAGSQKSGVGHASADLFEGSVSIVTPAPHTQPGQADRTGAFWTALGARVVRMSPEEHDQAVAGVSHLPHAVASVLAAMTDLQYLELAAGGWQDTTRIASGDVELWRQIFLDNRSHSLQALDNFAKVLASFREALAREDSAGLLAILQAGKQNRDSVAS